MKELFILSDTFSARELQEALRQEIQDEDIQFKLQEETTKSLEAFVDPSLVVALLSSGGVATIVGGLFNAWRKHLEKKEKIEIAKIQADKEKEIAVEIARIQAETQKATAHIKIKTANGEIEVPSHMFKEEREVLLQSLEAKNVKSIALITEVSNTP